MKKQYKSLQRTEIGKLKKQMRVLKSEKVRRKEVKDRIEETLESKKQTNSVKESKEEGHHQLLMQKGTVVFLETSSEHFKRQDIKVRVVLLRANNLQVNKANDIPKVLLYCCLLITHSVLFFLNWSFSLF